MDLDKLNAMKYGDLLKLAKEKVNVTKRIPRDKLIEKLMEVHQNLLQDQTYVSDDASDESVVQKVKVKKRGKKRGKRGSTSSDPHTPTSKKQKKETSETVLNSTFSIDSDEDSVPMEKRASPGVLPKVVEARPKVLRGRKRVKPTSPAVDKFIVTDLTLTVKSPEQPATQFEKKNLRGNPAQKPVEVAKTPPVQTRRKRKNSCGKKKSNGPTAPNVQLTEPAEPKTSTRAEDEHMNVPAPLAVEPVQPESLNKTQDVPAEPKVSPIKPQLPPKTAEMEEEKPPKPVAEPVTLTSATKRKSVVLSSRPSDKKRSLTVPKTPGPQRKSLANPPPPVALKTPRAAAAAAVVSQIPKLSKPKAAPNFAEIHQKNFLKMQSVDEYVEKKKRARNETLASASANKAAVPRAKPVFSHNVTIGGGAPATPVTDSSAKGRLFSTPGSTKSVNINFVSGIQKPVFTAQGSVATEKKRVMATLKESHQTLPSVARAKKASIGAALNRSESQKSMVMGNGEILRGVRVNRRFQLQMQHRNLNC